MKKKTQAKERKNEKKNFFEDFLPCHRNTERRLIINEAPASVSLPIEVKGNKMKSLENLSDDSEKGQSSTGPE